MIYYLIYVPCTSSLRALCSIRWYRTFALGPSRPACNRVLSCSVHTTQVAFTIILSTMHRYIHSILHNYKEAHRECCQFLIEYPRDMAPSKVRAGHDDSRSEASSTREKQNAGHTTTATKGRRAAHGAATSSSLRDVTTAGSVVAAAAAGASNASSQEANVGVSIHSPSGIVKVADRCADTMVNTRYRNTAFIQARLSNGHAVGFQHRVQSIAALAPRHWAIFTDNGQAQRPAQTRQGPVGKRGSQTLQCFRHTRERGGGRLSLQSQMAG